MTFHPPGILAGATVALTRPKRYGDEIPEVDGAHVVLSSEGEATLVRTVLLRPRAESDLEDARKATAGGGLRELASRCPTVALVVLEPDASDRGALRVAALLSSVMLGPILSPDKSSLLGALGSASPLPRSTRTPSCSRSQRLRPRPPAKPVRAPFAPTTRWQGTMMLHGFIPTAAPTARTALGLPTLTATSA